MTGFTLDTSGYVLAPNQCPPPGDRTLTIRWNDLGSRQQEAVMEASHERGVGKFSDWSGEALAGVLREATK